MCRDTPPRSCLHLQTVHGAAHSKAVKSHLCPQRSHLLKDILTSHETHIHSTLFWSGLSPPASPTPDGNSYQCLLAPVPTWVLVRAPANAPIPPFLLLPLLPNGERNALLPNTSKFSWVPAVPGSALMFMLHAIDWVFPRCNQRAALYIACCGKPHIVFLNHTGPLQQFFFISLHH